MIGKSRGNPRCSNLEHTEPRVLGTDGYLRCRQCKREQYRRYVAANPHLKKIKEEAVKRWRKAHPERRAAQAAANHKRGELLAKNCRDCGTTKRLEMHHPDYSKPLEVITLCKQCHENIHHYPPNQDKPSESAQSVDRSEDKA